MSNKPKQKRARKGYASSYLPSSSSIELFSKESNRMKKRRNGNDHDIETKSGNRNEKEQEKEIWLSHQEQEEENEEERVNYSIMNDNEEEKIEASNNRRLDNNHHYKPFVDIPESAPEAVRARIKSLTEPGKILGMCFVIVLWCF